MTLLIKNPEVKIAAEHLNVVKVIRREARGLTKKVVYQTPYQLVDVVAGQRFESELEIVEQLPDRLRIHGARCDGTDIYTHIANVGLHAYTFVTDAQREIESWEPYRKYMIGMPDFVAVNCVIPKGTRYVSGVTKITYPDEKAKGPLGHSRTDTTIFADAVASEILIYPAKLP